MPASWTEQDCGDSMEEVAANQVIFLFPSNLDATQAYLGSDLLGSDLWRSMYVRM